MKTDREFIEFLGRCIDKEKDAWDAFVKNYSSIIYNYILRTLQRYNYFIQNDEVDELFNKVFLNLLDKDCQRLKNFRGKNERSFCAYLREICFNMSIDFLRQQRNFIKFENIQYKISEEDNFKELDKKDATEVISSLVKDLPIRQRYLFNLIYEEGLDLKHISKNMNLKLNAIHQLKYRMINNLIKIAKKKNLFHEVLIR